MIIPSIDLMGGKAVQLRQGKEKVLERDDVLSLARRFSLYGDISVIDLDSALGKGDNLDLIKELCRIADCRVGGGIRTVEKAQEILAAGAKKIIIGTSANPDFLGQLPKERVIVAIDTKDGFVADKGWTRSTKKLPEEVIFETEKYCCEFLFTDVDNEGMMKGFDPGRALVLREKTSNKITVAGGIKESSEVVYLESKGFNCQLGMSIYTGKIMLEDAFLSLLDFGKGQGLIPTIVQEENGQVLMLAYSSKESLKKAFSSGKATYFSRSRNIIWTKGETSGNFQELLKVRYDCDRDTLLFTVRQKGSCCHMGSYSCFGEKQFSLSLLYQVIADRVNNPREGSYTSKISLKERWIKEKIKEESGEVLDYRDRENLVWEIADLSYFLLVLMAKKGITPDEIRNELARRRR